jgi:hypothetical protein
MIEIPHYPGAQERFSTGPLMTSSGAMLGSSNLWRIEQDCIIKKPFYPNPSEGHSHGDSKMRWPNEYIGGEFLGNEEAGRSMVYTDTV